MASEPKDPSPAEIELNIERTRERMSSNIDELGDRLSPENLKRQAKEAAKTRPDVSACCPEFSSIGSTEHSPQEHLRKHRWFSLFELRG